MGAYGLMVPVEFNQSLCFRMKLRFLGTVSYAKPHDGMSFPVDREEAESQQSIWIIFVLERSIWQNPSSAIENFVQGPRAADGRLQLGVTKSAAEFCGIVALMEQRRWQ